MRVDVKSAQDMLRATEPLAQSADVFVATAAVADWRPASACDHKIKKDGSGRPPELSFTENPDILATVARSARAKSGALFCVGFAAESHDLAANAQAKRVRKGVPLLVGNIGPATFGADDNALLLVDDKGTREVRALPNSNWPVSSWPKSPTDMTENRRQGPRLRHGGRAAGLRNPGQRRGLELPRVPGRAASTTINAWCLTPTTLHENFVRFSLDEKLLLIVARSTHEDESNNSIFVFDTKRQEKILCIH